MELDTQYPMDGRPILADPELRPTARDLVRRSLEILDPDEADLVEELIDPLVDRAIRGERIDPGAGDVPGGFGGADLVVWAVVPIVLHAISRLFATLGDDWIHELRERRAEGRLPEPGSSFAISLEEAEVVVQVSGLRDHRHRLPELVGAVHEAILSTLDALNDGGNPHRSTRRAAPYRDFAIEVGSDGEGKLGSRVLTSSGGSARSRFRLPFDAGDLPRILTGLEAQVRGPHRHFAPVDSPSQRWGARRLGSALFESLMTGGVRDAYERSLATAKNRRENLRLRLVLDPAQRSVTALPWEMLLDRRTGTFLSHDPRTPVVRCLQVEEPSDPRLQPARLPLRVLIAAAQPRDTAELVWERECELVAEALRQREGVHLEIVREAAATGLRRAIRKFSPHVLHFIGHGTFAAASGSAAVLLTGPDETADGLSGTELSTLLLGADDLRLVVLNACDTAALPRRDGLDPFSAVAAALVRGGAPAVVAMQFPITDDAAVLFSSAFYEALAAGDPLETAVVEGRQAILDRDRRQGSCEWATPVLYLQVRDGDLFHLGTGE